MPALTCVILDNLLQADPLSSAVSLNVMSAYYPLAWGALGHECPCGADALCNAMQEFESRQVANILWAAASLRDWHGKLVPCLDARILEVSCRRT